MSKTMHNVSIEELRLLAKDEIDCKVAYLKISLKGKQHGHDNRRFHKFCRKFVSFLREIPVIEYEGTVYDFSHCNLPEYKNIKQVDFTELEGHYGHIVPPTTEILKYDMSILGTPGLKRWPRDLKYLEFNCGNASVMELPKELEELRCYETEDIWTEFPESLKVLKLADLDATEIFEYPAGLTELDVTGCGLDHLDFLADLPNLKTLVVGYSGIGSLAQYEFPASLEVLDVLYCELSSIKDAKFPPNLRELNLAANQLTKVDLSKLKNLESLNLSNYLQHNKKLIDCAPVWPENLKSLQTVGQVKLKWTPLPETLRELRITLKGEPPKFPEGLQKLHIEYDDPKAKFSSLKLPPNLAELTIFGGTSSEFDWDLPCLEKLTVKDFKGRITIPENVARLQLLSEDKSVFENLTLPPGLEELLVTYPVSHLPDSLALLKIYKFQEGADLVLPKNLVSLELHQDRTEKTKPEGKHSLDMTGVEFFTSNVSDYFEVPESVRWFTFSNLLVSQLASLLDSYNVDLS